MPHHHHIIFHLADFLTSVTLSHSVLNRKFYFINVVFQIIIIVESPAVWTFCLLVSLFILVRLELYWLLFCFPMMTTIWVEALEVQTQVIFNLVVFLNAKKFQPNPILKCQEEKKWTQQPRNHSNREKIQPLLTCNNYCRTGSHFINSGSSIVVHSSMRLLLVVDSLLLLSDFWFYFHSASPLCECKTAANCSELKCRNWSLRKIAYKLQLAAELKYFLKYNN